MIFIKRFGNLQLRVLILSLFFSSFVYGQELDKKIVKLPTNLYMVGEDNTALVGNNYEYKVHSLKSIKLSDKYTSTPKTIDDLMSSLITAYKKQSISLLKPLFIQDAFNSLKEKNFQEQFEILNSLKNPEIKYSFQLQDGFVIAWGDSSFRYNRQVYTKKVGNVYLVSVLNIKKENLRFWNLNLYFNQAPYYIKSVKKSSVFSKITDGEKKKLKFTLSSEGNYIILYRKKDKISVMLKDNKRRDGVDIQDSNLKSREVEFSLSGENFADKGDSKIYYFESSYPITRIRSEDHQKAKSFIVTKY